MIGWYVHHHGQGHLTRARAVLPGVDEPVVGLSSLPEPAGAGFAGWLQLDRDDDVADAANDSTAAGRLHWVPTDSRGLTGRMAALAGWLAAARPRLLVVDVSVEVSLLARLCGVPVVVVAGPGDRDDAAHQLAYGIAEHIVAAWPREIYEPAFLRAHRSRTSYLGALSRFDREADSRRDGRGDGVLALTGGGGTGFDQSDVEAAAAATPGTAWRSAGLGGDWTADVWTALVDAEVVVTHAGQNALAEVAAARRPAVIVPQHRPFAEQHRVASALQRHGLAVVSERWGAPGEWPGLIDTARAIGGGGWKRWNDGRAAARFAEVIATSGRPC